MEELLIDNKYLNLSLLDSIEILGLSVETLHHLLIRGKDSAPPEVLFQLPPKQQVMNAQELDMIFTDQIVHLESNPFTPRFFANSLNNEEDVTTYIHCLFVYELITPSIVDASKSRTLPNGFFEFIHSEKDPTDILNSAYVPIVICIKSKNNYVDFFRKILKSLYLHLTEITSENLSMSAAMKTMEFLKFSAVLINDCIVPPYDMRFSLKLGKHQLAFPFESRNKITYNESALAILVDLVDIRNIIDIWENLMTNKHVFLMSCNEYLLFLINQAFKSLLFPMKWEDKVIPVLAPHLIDILDCPFPVLIGFSTLKISREDAFERLEEKIILDIDSNIIHYLTPNETNTQDPTNLNKKSIHPKYEEILCECTKSTLSKKLQLVKSYYYTDSKRIKIFRRLQMERAIEDEEFVNSARKLLEENLAEERENLFVDLVKKTFFQVILDGLSDFNLYMEKKSNNVYVFNKEIFKNNQGFCKKCRSGKFWQSVIENSNFQQLIKYYRKYDESHIARFEDIVKASRSPETKQEPEYNFNIGQNLSPKVILEGLKADLEGFQVESSQESFKKDTAIMIIKNLQNALSENTQYYEEAELTNFSMMRRHSFTINSARESMDIRLYQSTFYGNLGVIKCLSSIFQLGAIDNFKKISFIHMKINAEINFQSTLVPKRYEPVLLKLLYLLKSDTKFSEYQSIIDLMRIMNQKCPDLLSEHIMFFCLNRIIDRNETAVRILMAVDGKLGNIAKEVVSIRNENEVSEVPVYSADDLNTPLRYFRTLSENNPNTFRI